MTFFGKLEYVFLLKLPRAPDLGLKHRKVVVLAVIAECDSLSPHPSRIGMFTYSQLKSSEVVDAATVQSLVGRIYWDKQWVIFDRAAGMKSLFSEADRLELGEDTE